MVCQTFVSPGLADIGNHSQSSRTVALQSFIIVSSTLAVVSSETDGHPERCSSWTSVLPSLNSLDHLRTCCTLIHFSPFTQLGINVHRCSVFCTQKTNWSVIHTWWEKQVGAPSLTAAKPRLSVADSSPVWGLGDGEPKLHASVAESRVTAFLATAVFGNFILRTALILLHSCVAIGCTVAPRLKMSIYPKARVGAAAGSWGMCFSAVLRS